MRFAIPPLAKSLGVHALLVGGIAWFLAQDGGRVEGEAGLAGNMRTRFDVTVDAVVKPKSVPVSEGLPIEDPIQPATELPTEVKHPNVREAGEATGTEGQAGSGTVAAEKIGDSDRTNRLGLYYQKMVRKIQSNLGAAGYMQFPAHAKLLLDLKKDGHVTKIVVLESSGDPALDRLAIRAVEKSNPFDPWDVDQQVQLPVVFR